MKEILLAIDESEDRARAQADTVIDLFDLADVRGHLLHDFVDNPEGASVNQVSAVRRASETLEAAGVEVQYHERSGVPAESIIEVATEIDADAICIAGRKRTPTGKLLFGSVSQKVLLNTERPVLACSVHHDND